MTAPVAELLQPERQYLPHPDDKLSGYAIGWLGFVLYFVILEGIALHQDVKHPDRVKRTLSANLRYVFATDSVTGVPLAVRYGRLRRFALGVALGPGWLPHHLGREGAV